ncbi:UvrD-helicase domain-containing protein [Slackia heliotrinireducens]|uniref:UvrD-helicase domain-containing protein n=1 Tax=Slackia heliotrinireducens TaxID=84110 RepID=UPI0033148D24
MNKETFTPPQRASVETLDRPLVISAGAGSGKTFTLTQRIAWALLPGSGEGGDPFVDSIDEVMAITFTTKAAQEIKARVKSTLRAEGMVEESLKVDSAWISTIHGMCSRILREHALEIGIDPAFTVLNEADATDMMERAIQTVLSQADELMSPEGMDGLFAEYSIRPNAFGGESIERMIRSLANAAASSPAGFDALRVPPEGRGWTDLLRAAWQTWEDMGGVVRNLKASATRDALLAKGDDAAEAVQALLMSGEEPTPEACLEILSQFPDPNGRIGRSDEAYCEGKPRWKQMWSLLAGEALCKLSRPFVNDLITLSKRVLKEYEALKSAAYALDNTDLLVLAFRAFDQHPEIADQYARTFKLVMIDEFQDTDQLQIDMISHMAGEGLERLCTVGDAQQSIYRFRGADVDVYRRHVERMQKRDDAVYVELHDNFRSHADVLSFVDCLFGRSWMFGDAFMSLAPGRNEAKVKRPYRSDTPRIQLQLVEREQRDTAAERATGADACRIEALGIAKRFSELRRAGHPSSDMVVLLGRMTNADVYAQVLRDAGFECVIAGGSLFGKMPETLVVLRLLQVAADPNDAPALFEVLTSDMFALSADDLLVLATDRTAKEGLRKRDISKGLFRLHADMEEGMPASPALRHAVEVLRDMCFRAGSDAPDRILTEALVRSGWLSRLQEQGAQGMAVAGNVLKAVRMAGDICQENVCGVAAAAREMAARLESCKEAPGALSAEAGDFVRIMTIHASKGLEFPIVAVADFAKERRSSAGKFMCETIRGTTYISLMPGNSASDLEVLTKRAKAYASVDPEKDDVDLIGAIESAASQTELRSLLTAYGIQQEKEESQRLLYVALTRASESLFVSMHVKRTKQPAVYIDTMSDIRAGLMAAQGNAEGDFPDQIGVPVPLEYGGSAPALFTRLPISRDASGGLSYPDALQGFAATLVPAQASSTVVLPDPGRGIVAVDGAPSVFDRGNVRSYSSLEEALPAGFLEGETDALGVASPSPFGAVSMSYETEDSRAAYGSSQDVLDDPFADDDAFWDELAADLSSDTDKATDVGSAFHALAQWSVEMANGQVEGDGHAVPLPVPDAQRIAAVMKVNGVDVASHVRLEEALLRWYGSDACARALACKNLQAEAPFFVTVPDDGGTELYLEGSIDLLASDGGFDQAYIVDYKTGGHEDETSEKLQTKHLLQATCYAYALFTQGYGRVDLSFVRVEQEDADAPGQPQCVNYSFTLEDAPVLAKRILSAYKAGGRS